MAAMTSDGSDRLCEVVGDGVALLGEDGATTP
jgi:hypothetical protein